MLEDYYKEHYKKCGKMLPDLEKETSSEI